MDYVVKYNTILRKGNNMGWYLGLPARILAMFYHQMMVKGIRNNIRYCLIMMQT